MHFKVELKTGSVLYRTELWDCFGYAIASFIGCDDFREGNWVNSYLLKTVPQCNLTQHCPSVKRNLKMANFYNSCCCFFAVVVVLDYTAPLKSQT